MKTAENSQTSVLLTEIRDLFGKIRAITKRLLENFSPDALEDTLRTRSQILCRIDAQKMALNVVAGPSSWTGYEEYREIQDHIGAIKGLDREVTMTATRRMYEIKRELAALSDSSRVAKTYARYCRS
jgi:hypothetical protein